MHVCMLKIMFMYCMVNHMALLCYSKSNVLLFPKKNIHCNFLYTLYVQHNAITYATRFIDAFIHLISIPSPNSCIKTKALVRFVFMHLTKFWGDGFGGTGDRLGND